jgi:hypothetical protein
VKNKPVSMELCRKYCFYYKPSKKENSACMGFIIAEKLFEVCPAESLLLSPEPLFDRAKPELPPEEIVRKLAGQICPPCPFAEHDCDFMENWKKGASGSSSRLTPCGGFLFIGILLDRKILELEKLKKVIQREQTGL